MIVTTCRSSRRPPSGELNRAPAAPPVEQPDAQRRLEPHHVLADGGLRVVEGVGRAMERAFVGHGPEAQQLAEAEVRERVREHGAGGQALNSLVE